MRRPADAPALRARLRRTLDVDPRRHPRGARHLSAASGLVRVGDRLHLVADDEHHLASLDARSPSAPIALHRLFAGTLPPGKRARKRRKPDLECLFAVDDALVALGSGSRPNRNRGVRIPLGTDGMPSGAARRLDLAPLYAPLRDRIAELNVEGAFRLGTSLVLLQRGNGGAGRNAVVVFDWRSVAEWLAAGADAPRPTSVREVDLGTRDGVPYGFTDGAALDAKRFVFSAVLEATDDAYADGANGGSLLGIASADGTVQRTVRVAGRWKIEGIAVRTDGDVLVVDAVTDADDPGAASALLRLRWPLPGLTQAA